MWVVLCVRSPPLRWPLRWAEGMTQISYQVCVHPSVCVPHRVRHARPLLTPCPTLTPCPMLTACVMLTTHFAPTMHRYRFTFLLTWTWELTTQLQPSRGCGSFHAQSLGERITTWHFWWPQSYTLKNTEPFRTVGKGTVKHPNSPTPPFLLHLLGFWRDHHLVRVKITPGTSGCDKTEKMEVFSATFMSDMTAPQSQETQAHPSGRGPQSPDVAGSQKD